MNVSLTKELEGFVSSLVKSGDYYSASEVVRAGLRVLKEQETLKQIKIEELRGEIQKGADAMKAGQYTTISNKKEAEKLKARIQKNGVEKLAKRKQK